MATNFGETGSTGLTKRHTDTSMEIFGLDMESRGSITRLQSFTSHLTKVLYFYRFYLGLGDNDSESACGKGQGCVASWISQEFQEKIGY
ncbi:hypothetical protein HID58_093862 [Brassica napus]|uniref:Uncharacterized protein n=1 Tax=Brassica napus TaxID=3708 RepID=A0ABQ7X9K4_BRANA|nr:hypothetical protein HID58_093862 [Brassica napus]